MRRILAEGKVRLASGTSFCVPNPPIKNITAGHGAAHVGIFRGDDLEIDDEKRGGGGVFADKRIYLHR
jgi:hypothetical protein